jgi:colicin import membrane protein
LSLPTPLPVEEGFQVDFGNSETGLGKEEPSAAMGTETVSAAEKSASAAKPVSSPPKASKAVDKGDEDLVTQNYEKTVAVEAAKAKKKLLDDKKAKLEEEKELKAQEKQQREEALEIQRQEAAERRIAQAKMQKKSVQ